MKEKKNSNFLVIIVFFLISMLLVMPMINTGNIKVMNDGSFHFSRVEEIYQNLKTGSFNTFIATHTFHHTGIGNFLFYPTIFLYPWAILRFIFSPVESFYIWSALITFITFIVAYFCMLYFSEKNQKRAIIFSLIYTLNPYRVLQSLRFYGEGSVLAYAVIPIVFLGIYWLVQKKYSKWPLISIGMTLVMYSHLASFYLTTLILSIIMFFRLIIDHSDIKQIIISIIKSIFLFILLTGWILIPFLTDYITKNLYAPSASILTMYPHNNNLMHLFIKFIILSLVTLVGFFVIKKNKSELMIFIIGIILLFMSFGIFPWKQVFHVKLIYSVFAPIQFVSRLQVFSSLFIAVSLSYMCMKIKFLKKLSKLIWIVFFAFFALIEGVYIVHVNELNSTLSKNYLKTPSDLKFLPGHGLCDVKLENNQNYNELFNYIITYGELDYGPIEIFQGQRKVNPVKIEKQETLLNNMIIIGNKKIKGDPVSSPNKISYKIKLQNKKNVDFPVINYKHTIAKVNGKKVKKYDSSRGTIELKLSKGVNKIDFEYKPSILWDLFVMISIVSWSALLFEFLRKKLNIRYKKDY